MAISRRGKRWALLLGLASTVILCALVFFLEDSLRLWWLRWQWDAVSVDSILSGSDDHEKWERWEDISVRINKAFWEHAEEPDTGKTIVGRLFEEFGQRGPEVDLKLFLCGPAVFVPEPSYRPTRVADRASVSRRWGALEGLQLAACEKQVPVFLASKPLFERYYNALMWSREFFVKNTDLAGQVGARADYLEESFSPDSGQRYWWYARDFLVLAHATGRDDLLEGVEPWQLHLRFRRWKTWLEDVRTGKYRVTAHPEKPVWVFKEITESAAAVSLPPLRKPTAPFPEWIERRIVPPSPANISMRLWDEVFGIRP